MLDIPEVAQQLGSTESGVRKLVAKREIKFYQHGKHGRIRFKQEWIDEFIEKHTVSPPDETLAPVPPRKHKGREKHPAPCDGKHGLNWELLRV